MSVYCPKCGADIENMCLECEDVAALQARVKELEEHECTVKSIATMLGWLNVPPQRMLEGQIRILKELRARVKELEERDQKHLAVEFKAAAENSALSAKLAEVEKERNKADKAYQALKDQVYSQQNDLAATDAEITALHTQVEQYKKALEDARKEVSRLTEGWKQAEHDKNTFFDQSCINLKRAEEAEAKLAEVEKERDLQRESADRLQAELARERDRANMVADAAAEKIKELESHRAPNPGVVGTIRDKNALIEYKDAQIAKLQDRVHELEVENAALKAQPGLVRRLWAMLVGVVPPLRKRRVDSSRTLH